MGHAILTGGDNATVLADNAPLFLSGMAVAGAGAGLFVYAIPESYAPGKFDIVGSSHQLWHICIFVFTAVGLHITTDIAENNLSASLH